MAPVLRYVVPNHEPVMRRDDGDTASCVVAIDSDQGSDLLGLQLGRYEQGRSRPRALDGIQEIMYVVSGRGTVFVDGRPEELEPGTAVYVVTGESYEVENPGPESLLIVSATAPQADGAARPDRRTVRYADQPSLPQGGAPPSLYPSWPA